MKHWLELALTEALSSIDPEVLLTDIAHHINPEEKYHATVGKIRPSLIADNCPLAQMKKMHNHGPQPGMTWVSARNGRPNAGTGMNYLRGWAMEGLVVAALERTSYCKILGKSPDLVFKHANLEAHPDVLVEFMGKPLLIQIKNPSVFAFERMAKSGEESALTRYLPQVAAELYIGRQAGYQLEQATILAVTWEPWPPTVTLDHGLKTLIWDLEWNPEMEGLILHEIEKLQTAYALTGQGQWPQPFPASAFDKFPCTYCKYARLPNIGIVACDDTKAWESGPQLKIVS
jgi:hypothetical protein